MPGGRPYTIVSAGDDASRGMMAIPPEAKAMGVRPCWSGYVGVEDVDKPAAKVTAAGGSVMRPGDATFPASADFAVVADPHGAGFMLFRDAGGDPPPARAARRLACRLARTARRRRRGRLRLLFRAVRLDQATSGMDMGAMGVYQLFGFAGGDGDDGGIMTSMPQIAGAVLALLFQRPAIDAAAERVKAKGGKIVNGPMEVPGGNGSSRRSTRKARCSRWSRPSAETTAGLAALSARGPAKRQ